jgi:hypothetical protein
VAANILIEILPERIKTADCAAVFEIFVKIISFQTVKFVNVHLGVWLNVIMESVILVFMKPGETDQGEEKPEY